VSTPKWTERKAAMGSNIQKDSDEYQGRRQGRRQGEDQGQGQGSRQQQLSASAHISRDQIGELFLEAEHVRMPVVQEEDRVPLVIDASTLDEEELDELRITDPFMYYSIPSVRNASLRGSITSSEAEGSVNQPSGSGRQVQHRRQSAPAALLAGATDAAAAAETQVRRRSRISFELSFDAVMSDIIESITEGGLDVGGDDDDDGDGSYDDFLDWLSNASTR
jgi:hypothetical protein